MVVGGRAVRWAHESAGRSGVAHKCMVRLTVRLAMEEFPRSSGLSPRALGMQTCIIQASLAQFQRRDLFRNTWPYSHVVMSLNWTQPGAQHPLH